MRVPESRNPRTNKELIAIETKYPKSGLYPKGGSTPFWTVDWYAHKWNVVLSRSGEFAVAHYSQHERKSYVLAFFSRGKLTKTWTASEVDPELVRSVGAQKNDQATRGWGGWREFNLSMDKAVVSKDGYFELPTHSGTVAFSMTSGEMLRKPQPPPPYKCPEDPVAYEAFCRELGTTGTRNPNFISGLPEPEFELVPIPRPPRHAKPHAVVAPYDPYRFVSPPLPADPTDWRWFLVAGTALSYVLCFSAIRLRLRRS
jgi:hypothetical protein